MSTCLIPSENEIASIGSFDEFDAEPLTENDDVQSIDDLDDVRTLATTLTRACQANVQGRDDVIQLILIALLADGHVLLEDHPGSGKTTLAKALGGCIDGDDSSEHITAFRRIQFTPDLMPSDVIGSTVFHANESRFEFHPGPVFANIVLADEINRTGPKVQAALLEAMGEKQVTIDNRTYSLDEMFFVLATQNPLDLNGTYPLPAAQLDRFLFKVRMTHLSRESELDVLAKRATAADASSNCSIPAESIVAARHVIRETVHVSPAIHECLVDVGQAMRHDRRVAQGISTRSLVLAIGALQARAAVLGRDYVSPHDIKELAVPLFSHRLQVGSSATTADDIVNDCALPVLESAIRRSLRK